MITSGDPAVEKRRQLLTVIQYHAAQMDTDDLQRLADIMGRCVWLNRISPRLGSRLLRFEIALWRRGLREA